MASYAIGVPSTSNTGDQVRVGRRTWATEGSSWLSTELDLLFLWFRDCLGCFLWKGPTLLLQNFQSAFSSLDLGWVSTQDQQESKGEEEEEDLLGAWTYSCP